MNNLIIDNRDSKKNPLISIVIVTFNAGSTLASTLESIEVLHLDEVEVIIIDGNSSDNTVSLINSYQSIVNFCISENDSGIYDAMNKGIKFSNGKYIYFLGADDILLSDFRDIIPLLNDSNDIVYANVKLLSDGSIYCGKFNKYKLMQCNICHQSIFYPKNIIDNNLFDLKYSLLADYALNIFLFSKYRFTYVSKVVALYNNKGASSVGDIHFESDKMKLIRNSLGFKFYFMKLFRSVTVKLYKKLL